jgi:hypothetical protein
MEYKQTVYRGMEIDVITDGNTKKKTVVEEPTLSYIRGHFFEGGNCMSFSLMLVGGKGV